jgi:lipopolysaccharide export system permease protein
MGKTLRRYLVREIGAAFVAGLGILTFVLLVARILEMVDLVLARGVPATKILALFAYVLPSFLELTIPAALLLSIVIAFGRLTSDGEITAILAAGIPSSTLFVPALAFAALVAVATFVLAAEARPWANRRIQDTVLDIARTRATAALRPGVFNSDFDGFVIYAEGLDPERGLLSGILLADERKAGERTTVFAQAGRVIAGQAHPSIFLQLLDGSSIMEESAKERFEVTDFESLEVRLQSEGAAARLSNTSNLPQNLPWNELRRLRDDLVRSGESATAPTIEIHARAALAAASFLLAAVAVPLGLRKARSVRARGFLMSGVVIFGYYLVLSAGTMLAKGGYVPAAVGPWIPNAVLAVAALALVRNAAFGRGTAR